jgi:hypothetical protein
VAVPAEHGAAQCGSAGSGAVFGSCVEGVARGRAGRGCGVSGGGTRWAQCVAFRIMCMLCVKALGGGAGLGEGVEAVEVAPGRLWCACASCFEYEGLESPVCPVCMAAGRWHVHVYAVEVSVHASCRTTCSITHGKKHGALLLAVMCTLREPGCSGVAVLY